MKDELEQKLVKDFPDLYKQIHLTPEESCLSFGIECEDGWFDIIYSLSEKISKLDPHIEFSQVKEKFGGLRIYMSNVSQESFDKMYELINEAENESFKTCEYCGSKNNVTTKGSWIKTLCDNCRNERSNKN